LINKKGFLRRLPEPKASQRERGIDCSNQSDIWREQKDAHAKYLLIDGTQVEVKRVVVSDPVKI